MAECRVCGGEAGAGGVYCARHLRAYNSLEAAYPRWRHALGLDWPGYLEKVIGAPGTGAWVKEVAADILGSA